MTTDIYKKAAKLKLRFDTQVGSLTCEQLFDFNLSQLDELAVHYNELHEKSSTKSYLSETTPEDKVAKLRFDIVLDILKSKQANQERAAKSEATKLKNQKILDILNKKKDSALEDLSVEELEAQLED